MTVGWQEKRSMRRSVIILLALAFLATAGFAVRHILVFKDSFVMLTVEESSTSALLAWPLLGEQIPCAYVDCAGKVLQVPRKPNLLGVSLCVYRSSTSQGVLFSDSIDFWRLGSGEIDLDRDASLPVRDFQGRAVEALDGEARVLRGKLKVKKTSEDGTVWLDYDGRPIVLKPGESWAELLVASPEGVREVGEHEWSDRLNEAILGGYPATRLAICNRGLWPKSNVEEAVWP
ncbi:MAG TPA: hypothetical protein GXX23_03865 [Firmicutes bacterium]|nr:hypothetical protein [Candidatus Fermentithermobacillaceae bacterium]